MSKTIERTALVEYTPSQMFELVNDIEAYPEFMDGCVGSEILSKTDACIEARLDLKKGKFSQSFITRNMLEKNQCVNMQLVDGPFKQLDGQWTFEALGDSACKVSLSLTFEFKNKLVALAAGSWFESVGNQLVDAVCLQAKKRYS
ncbi:MAG: type II toxin-antitoxin system RatA family toxin [Cellvibrionaceae bacterium]